MKRLENLACFYWHADFWDLVLVVVVYMGGPLLNPLFQVLAWGAYSLDALDTFSSPEQTGETENEANVVEVDQPEEGDSLGELDDEETEEGIPELEKEGKDDKPDGAKFKNDGLLLEKKGKFKNDGLLLEKKGKDDKPDGAKFKNDGLLLEKKGKDDKPDGAKFKNDGLLLEKKGKGDKPDGAAKFKNDGLLLDEGWLKSMCTSGALDAGWHAISKKLPKQDNHC